MRLIDTITVLVCLSAGFSYVNHRWIKLPLTIGLMAIALGMSLTIVVLGRLGFGIEHAARVFIDGIDFNTALMHGMLSFLLFAGALHVNLYELLQYKWIVGTLASGGVLLSTAIVGGLTYALFSLAGIDLPLLDCLLFGALISPTDPIAVLGILKKVGVSRALELKITGESLFNDGAGVVVFLALLGVRKQGGETLGDVALLFLRETVGGLALGVGLGYLVYRMIKSVDDYQGEILLTLALVMGGYWLADALHASGPIAVVIAGLVIGNHGRTFGMSERTLERMDTFWELVDELLNAVLFVLMGLEVLVLSFRAQYIEAALLAIPIVLIARWLSVGLPVRFFGFFQEMPRGATMIMTWGGLRGGVSVALALSLPHGRTRDAIVTITYAVVAFSILVQGLTLGRVIRAAASPALSHPDSYPMRPPAR